MGKSFPFYDTKIQYDDDMIFYNDLRSNFIQIGNFYQDKFRKIIDESVARYQNDGDYERYFSTSVDSMMEIVSLAIEFSIFTLMQYGVDTYDRERFIALFDDSSEENLLQKLKVWEPIDNYVTIQIGIDDFQKGVAEQRNEERSNRSQYVNLISTDIKSAVRGEISAGIMNAGLGIVRSVKDSLQDSNDSKKLKRMIDEIVFEKSFQLSFINAVPVPFKLCFLKVAIVLSEHNMIKCPFSDEFLDNHDAFISKIKNYVEFGDKVVAFNLIKDYLQQDPYNVLIYRLAYDLRKDDKKDLIRLAYYFDVWSDYFDELSSSVDDENIKDYLFDVNIEEKISDLELKLSDYRKEHLA